MPRNPYTGVHNPNPYSIGAEFANPYIPTGGITDEMLPTVWTHDDDEVLYVPGGGPLVPTARVDPPNIRVEEVTLEVPVSHSKLAYALGAVDATIAGRRRFGYTIPEESRTVTTVGNEIIIRWEEHS